MKKTLIITSLIFLCSCSYLDESTFSLVCNVNSEWKGTIAGVKGQETKNEIVTLNFRNRKLDLYECPIWDTEQISCGNEINDGKVFLNERIVLDRNQESLNNTKTNITDVMSQYKTYTGQCEKIKQNKF